MKNWREQKGRQLGFWFGLIFTMPRQSDPSNSENIPNVSRQTKQSTGSKEEQACSMSSYKRLEDHYKNEHKLRKYIEQMYEEVKQTSDAKSQASSHLIAQLKETIDRLQNENKEMQQLYEQAEKKMKMMQTLTSIQIEIVNQPDNQDEMIKEDEQLFSCRVYGKANAVSEDPAIEFEVNLTPTEVEYSPIHIRTDIRPQLPEYMSEDIAFELKEAPVFISRLLDQVAATAPVASSSDRVQ